MKKLTLVLALVAATFAILYLSGLFSLDIKLGGGSKPDTRAEVKGSPIANLLLYKTRTGAIAHNTLKGKYVFINFWATWCKPCINELPFLDSLKRQFGRKNILFIGAMPDDSANAQKFFFRNKKSFSYELIYEADGLLTKLKHCKIQQWHSSSLEDRITGYPATFVINPRDSIIYFSTGVIRGDDVLIKVLEEIK